jgi:pre-mRNA-processing factor 6
MTSSIALEHIPNSVTLWKQTISLETSPADALILLSRAVEVLPHSIELWLALARLETPDKAKKVLNKARKAVPTSHEIWIAAGRLIEQEALRNAESGADTNMRDEKRVKLEEGVSNGKTEADVEKELEMVDKTIEAGVRELRRHQVVLTRDQWISEAEKCEAEGSSRTCEAIIKSTIDMDVEEEDRQSTWIADVESSLSRGRIGTARAILAYALKVFPDKKDLWKRAAELEKAHGTRYPYILFLNLLRSRTN